MATLYPDSCFDTPLIYIRNATEIVSSNFTSEVMARFQRNVTVLISRYRPKWRFSTTSREDESDKKSSYIVKETDNPFDPYDYTTFSHRIIGYITLGNAYVTLTSSEVAMFEQIANDAFEKHRNEIALCDLGKRIVYDGVLMESEWIANVIPNVVSSKEVIVDNIVYSTIKPDIFADCMTALYVLLSSLYKEGVLMIAEDSPLIKEWNLEKQSKYPKLYTLKWRHAFLFSDPSKFLLSLVSDSNFLELKFPILTTTKVLSKNDNGLKIHADDAYYYVSIPKTSYDEVSRIIHNLITF